RARRHSFSAALNADVTAAFDGGIGGGSWFAGTGASIGGDTGTANDSWMTDAFMFRGNGGSGGAPMSVADMAKWLEGVGAAGIIAPDVDAISQGFVNNNGGDGSQAMKGVENEQTHR
ncbi:hypothetical protein HDU76_009072, partial [Blyttiomyces sp. JEL0837]